MTHWSDEHIIAYLDGKLDMETGQALHRDRQHDPELDSYIRSMEIDTAELTNAGGDDLSGAPAFSFEQKPVGFSGWRQAAMAASVVAVFGLGFLTSKFLPADNPPPQTWLQAVAEYQMLYTADTLNLQEKTADQLGREVAEIGRKMQIILARSDLNVDGLQYKRGQLLSFKNKPLVQFAFIDDNNTPIAFCIIKRGEKPEQELTNKTLLAGLNAVTWSKGQYGFVVIGKSDPAKINQYAMQLQKRMASL